MESTDQNAVYLVIQSHPQNTIEADATMPSDAHGGEPSCEGHGLPGVIDLTAEPGEDTRITQLQALSNIFRDVKHNSFLSSSVISNDLMDVLPLMMDGPVQYARQLRTDIKQLQERTNWFEAENKKIHRKMDVLQSNFNYVEHALVTAKAISKDMEIAALKEQSRNEFLRIENSRLENALRRVMSAKRGSTEGSDDDEPRSKRSKSQI
ncbi:hypothetical protein V493_00203 [Pseudogymnoascus sp. VKM F-4281 (FW-2241)]|nr:hypothetical protein V493_00203 [Pseudogymnoascus sp. VKM F-4281 (FW-2241)]